MDIVVVPAGTSLLSQAQVIRTFHEILPGATVLVHSRLPEDTVFPFLLIAGAKICSDAELEAYLSDSTDDIHLFFTHSSVEARLKSLNISIQASGRFPIMWGTHETRMNGNSVRRLFNLETHESYPFVELTQEMVKRFLPPMLHSTVKAEWKPQSNRVRVVLTFPKELENKSPVQRRKIENHALADLQAIRDRFGFFSVEAYYDIHPNIGSYAAIATRLSEHSISPKE